MSLNAFDDLRAAHPDRRDVVTALERQIRRTLRGDPNAVIDDEILWQQIRLDRETTRRFLIELETADVLVRRLFWLCPFGGGTTSEASSVEEFPYTIECERCGRQHSLRSADVEVKFLPSEALLRDVVANSPQ